MYKDAINEIFKWVLIIGIVIGAVVAIAIGGGILIFRKTPEPTPQVNITEGSTLIEGVVAEIVPGEDGKSIVKFDNGVEASLYVGTHEVIIGEWNQIRTNGRGYIEEVWLGEDTMQDMIRE